jgi:hypothetical protein
MISQNIMGQASERKRREAHCLLNSTRDLRSSPREHRDASRCHAPS